MSKKRRKPRQEKIKLDPQPDNPRARKIMWLVISFFVLTIAIIWVWSIKVKFDNLVIKKTPESSLIQKSKQEWDAIFNDTSNSIATSTKMTSTTNINVSTNSSTTSTTKNSEAIKDYLEKMLTTNTTTSSTTN